MTTVKAALDAIASTLMTVDPSPEPMLDRVYVYPNDADEEPVDTQAGVSERFPFAIVEREFFRDADVVTRQTKSTMHHTFTAVFRIFLDNLIEPDVEIERKAGNWYLPIINKFVLDPTLGGVVEWIGSDVQTPNELVKLSTTWGSQYDQKTEETESYLVVEGELRVTLKIPYEEDYTAT